MDEDLKQNLTAGETWIRGLFILLFAFFLFVARIVTAAVVVIQFLFTVFTGKTNDNLRNLGAMLTRYINQCLLFVTYNSDVKPFPFSDWPEANGLAEEKKVTQPEQAKASPKKKASTRKKSTAKKTAKTKSEASTGTDTETPTGETESKQEP